MTKIFTAIDADGATLYRGRGKTGAAQRAIDALADYRSAVAAASGRLYGNPHALGHINVDGAEADTFGGYYIAEDMAR